MSVREPQRATEPPAPSSRYLDAVIETMARPELNELQAARLAEMVPYVYERSALVRQTWTAVGLKPGDVSSLEDFVERAPFLDKDAVRAFRLASRDPFGGLLCAEPEELALLGSTSGTTGDATPLPQQPRGPMVVGLSRDFWEAGCRPGDMVAYLMFTFRAGHGIERFDRIPLAPIFLDQGGADIETFVEAARRFRPKLAYTVNNVVVHALEAYSERTGEDLADALAGIEAVIFGGEPMSSRARRLFDRCGVRIQEMTTLGDVCGAIECRERAGYHAWEDLALVEHLDPHGTEPVEDGARGELVVTSLTDRAAPVIRYRTDDIVELTRMPCACGRSHARFRVLGRKGDEVLVDGRSVLPRDVWPAVEAVPATAAALFQIVRPARECDRLRLRVGHSGDTAAAGLAGDVADAVHARLGLRPEVELVPEQELLRLGPPHKIPRVTES
jgi:phenylacetate-CoA ligase